MLSFYNKALVNVAAARPKDKEIIKIIKYCNLQCKDNWRKWYDESGNILSLSNKNRLSLIKKSKTLLTVRDLYHKKSYHDLLSYSTAKLEYDERILLLGRDLILRAFKQLDRIPPLSLGWEPLQSFFVHESSSVCEVNFTFTNSNLSANFQRLL
jgi:hypothetical protein